MSNIGHFEEDITVLEKQTEQDASIDHNEDKSEVVKNALTDNRREAYESIIPLRPDGLSIAWFGSGNQIRIIEDIDESNCMKPLKEIKKVNINYEVNYVAEN